MNPAVDSIRDDVAEWLEFYGTAAERLGERLVDIEAALARGEPGTALYLLRQAKVTHSLLATGIARARSELAAPPASRLP